MLDLVFCFVKSHWQRRRAKNSQAFAAWLQELLIQPGAP
jgi:hypothetical protein